MDKYKPPGSYLLGKLVCVAKICSTNLISQFIIFMCTKYTDIGNTDYNKVEGYLHSHIQQFRWEHCPDKQVVTLNSDAE